MSRETVLVYVEELTKVRHEIVNLQTFIHGKKLVAILKSIDDLEELVREKLIVPQVPAFL